MLTQRQYLRLQTRLLQAANVAMDPAVPLLLLLHMFVAAVVSDAGAGGQVLLCSTTFGLVKDRLEELGQVSGST